MPKKESRENNFSEHIANKRVFMATSGGCEILVTDQNYEKKFIFLKYNSGNESADTPENYLGLQIVQQRNQKLKKLMQDFGHVQREGPFPELS